MLSAYGDVLDEDELADVDAARELRFGFDRVLSFTFEADKVRKISLDGTWD